MEDLRRLFAALGFSGVETFLASGNVVFETSAAAAGALETRIEKRLRQALRFDVETFVRTDRELARIAAGAPFPRAKLETAAEINVIFLKDRLDAETARRVSGLRTGTDEFRACGREIFWLRRKKAAGLYSTVALDKTLGRPYTVRAAKTIQKMVPICVPTRDSAGGPKRRPEGRAGRRGF